MRVVLDTNILVSACWAPGGLEATLVNLALGGRITACVSTEILAEYHDVLSRPKLAAVHDRALEILAALERAAFLAATTARVSASIDDDDNRFLECAQAAGAEYVVTGNLRHYPATWWCTTQGVIRIVNARTFLSCLHSASIGSTPLQ